MARLRRTPANEVTAAQFVQCIEQLAERCEPRAIFRETYSREPSRPMMKGFPHFARPPDMVATGCGRFADVAGIENSAYRGAPST